MFSLNLKVIRKFFWKHNKSFRCYYGDHEKHNLFPFEACERRNFDFCITLLKPVFMTFIMAPVYTLKISQPFLVILQTHKMNFFAIPIIGWTCFGYGKGSLKCTLFTFKILFVKNKYFIIYRKKNHFLRMCSVTSDTTHLLRTHKNHSLFSQAFKWKKKYVFRNHWDAI